MSRNDPIHTIINDKNENSKWWWEKIYKNSLKVAALAVTLALYMLISGTIPEMYLAQRNGAYLYNCYAQQRKSYDECINEFPHNNLMHFFLYASLAIFPIGMWLLHSLIPEYVVNKITLNKGVNKANYVLDAAQNFVTLFEKGQELFKEGQLSSSPFPREITAKIIEYATGVNYKDLFPDGSAATELLNKHLSGNQHSERLSIGGNNRSNAR